jgi:hypothetical protein
MKRSKYEKGQPVRALPRRHPSMLARTMAGGALAILAVGAFVAWGAFSRTDDGSDWEATRSYELPDHAVSDLMIEVSEPVSDLGRVALNTPAEATWLMRNTGTAAVRVGKPSIEVLEGC